MKSLHERSQIKDFYIRCIVQLIQTKCTRIYQFKNILKHILIIATAESDGNEIKGQPTPAENSRIYLHYMISGTVLLVQVDENEEHLDYKGITIDNECCCESKIT